MDLFKIGFLTVTIIDVLDIVAISYILYKLYFFIRGSRAAQMFIGLVLILVASVFVQLMGMSGLNWIFENMRTVWLVAFVILFQPELRRILIYIGQVPLIRKILKVSLSRRLTEEVLKAALELSKRGLGGLIVIVQNTGLKSILETGQIIQAEISIPLLISIFNPRSPLHDGAVIIQNEMIEAAKCILPLSQNPNLDPKFGTRHRAALGLSEETDAVIVIVSEETGKISLTFEGEIYPELDYNRLREKLNEFVKVSTGI
ncbi:TIGR00159 family protein [candidate division KSB1 bacterium]|nr:TIGR00159 family protein [candidate division KSB1 bacterium]MBL7092634.1 TIGR00159 family protein [candidate division KSB1 bacterium]